jgi:cytochrome c
MKTIRSLSSLRGTHKRQLALNRRATVMLAIGGALGLASQSTSARAETRMTKPQFQNLKAVGSKHQIVTIHHHGNTFEVATADGRNAVFPDANLRFKIDSSDNGPPAGRPVIVPGGMMGDRATVFFASPVEISTLIKTQS